MKFAEFLRSYRERQQISKTELAEKLSVSPGYIMNLESGRKRPPTITRVKQIAEILDLNSSEKDKLLQAAAEERVESDERTILKKTDESKPVNIKDTKIPVVTLAGATDEKGFEFEQLDPGEYEYIDFKNCKAIKITSNSMAPIAYAGQNIIYCEDATIRNGDLVFVRLKTGEQYFKRYFDDKNKKLVTLVSVNNTEPRNPHILKHREIEFMYRVVGVRF